MLADSGSLYVNDWTSEIAARTYSWRSQEISNSKATISQASQDLSLSSSRLCITTHSDPGETDSANDIVQTADGGWIVTGATGSYDDADTYNDIWIIKFQPDCSVEWQKVLDTFGAHFNGWQIISSSDNSYIIYVSTSSTKLIFKISDSGDLLWQKSYKTDSDFNVLLAIAEKSDGGAILVGRKDQLQEFIVLSINSDGEVLWQKSYSSPYAISTKEVDTSSDGSILIASRVTIDDINYLYAVKLDSGGTVIWQYTFSETEYSQIADALIHEDGSSTIVTSKNLVPESGNGSHILRLNADGTIRWEKFYYHQDSLGIYSLHETEGASLIGVGYYTEGTDQDVWVIKLDDLTGNILWQKEYALSDRSDHANAVDVMSDGNLLVAGNTRPGTWYNAFVMHITSEGNAGECDLSSATYAIITDTLTVPTAISFSPSIDGNLSTIDRTYSLQNSNVEFEAICGSDATVLNVPLFLQTDPAWSNELYGSYQTQPNNIGKWGCYMTSAAMIINYYAEQDQSPFRTDPGQFNSWLRSNNLYDGNLFVQASSHTYADQQNVNLFFPSPGRIDGLRNATSDAILDNSLSQDNPAILRVNAPSASGQHFVVAIGTTTVNNTPTYVINDPIYGQTTLYERYNNQYTSIRLFTAQSSERRTLAISAHSPVELLVTDPLGRKTGYDPTTGTSWNDIPNTSYTIDAVAPDGGLGSETPEEVKTLFVYGSIDGQYTVEIFGTGQGSYTINAFASDLQGEITSQTSQGEATDGSLDTIYLNYDSDTGLQNYSLYLPMITKN